MGKNSVRIAHALGIKNICNFWSIMPIVSVTECTRLGMTYFG